jgi:murein DD-endopeptidase MepM/ murein hydrolase activator NlpD
MPYHPVVLLPQTVRVLDLTGSNTFLGGPAPWSIGRYDEDRGIYGQALFQGDTPRTVHMGIDLGGPAGIAVHAFADGVVLHAGTNPAPGDYGPTLVTEHALPGGPLWALHGHLSPASLAHSPVGRRFAAGAVLGWLGEPADNGGWPPHLHFQLSVERPDTHDLPGVVTRAERAAARARFPDPRRVLGPIYADAATAGA